MEILGSTRETTGSPKIGSHDSRADAAPADPAVGPEAYPSWRALAWFSLFRLWIAFGLLVVFVPVPASFGDKSGFSLSAWVSVVYAVMVLLETVSRYLKWPSKERQVQVSVFLDIVAFTLLIHGSGSARGGLLLAIAVAAGALLMEGRLSLLFASFATLAVIAQETYAQLYLDSAPGGLAQAGLLGITFFTVATLGHVLYRRLQETQLLAARRQVDLDDLSKLNEFVIQSMGTGVLVVDGDKRVRLLNGAATALLGLRRSANGEQLQVTAPGLAQWLDDRNRQAFACEENGVVLVREQELKVSCHPLGEGPDAGILFFLRDHRELIREAQQIKLASLGRLTASIAHNIRNPLSSVSHAAQLLAEAPSLRPEDRRLTDIIRRNSGRIDDIIASILQLSRRNPAAPEVIDLRSWLGEFCAELRESWGLAAHRLVLTLPDEDLVVRMDPRHLRQILTNLCDNALKHGGGKPEPVKIRISARRDPVRANRIVEVEDDGAGIDPATAHEIFNPFFSTNPVGTGLGLYIAKELSETNGAQLQYIAPTRGGSRFRLDFPM